MILAPRHLPRLVATVGLFTRYGLADFARQQGLQGLAAEADADDAPDGGEGADGGQGGTAELAAAFRRRLVELGPAYVKLGQVLSTRPDLLPPAYIAELARLQDDVAPIPFEAVERTIEAELGGRLSKLFDAFEKEPLGSASLGQVHAATLRGGRAVVVKVQRPDIGQRIAEEVEFFGELARFLAEHTGAGTRVDLVGIVHQLERALTDELDYRTEARNAAAFRRTLAEYPRILVPRVIEAYSTQRVLTTERVRGVKIDALSPLARLDHDLAPVAEELTRAYLKQITIEGHFHADPHPGNVFVVLPHRDNPPTPAELVAANPALARRVTVTPLAELDRQAAVEAQAAPPSNGDDVKLALIDFGMTARLSMQLRERVVRLLLDVSDNRGDAAAQTLVEIGAPVATFDHDAYAHDVATLVARNHDLAVGELQAGSVLFDLINTSYRHGLRLPAELTLLAKAMFNLDAVARALDPTYVPMGTIREFAAQIATDRARRELHPRRLYQLATEGSALLAALPHRLDLISQRLANNEFQTRVDVPDLELLTAALQKVANRIFSGAVLAGLLVASAMLLPHRRTLGTVGFVLAGAIGLWMVLSILWSDRRRE